MRDGVGKELSTAKLTTGAVQTEQFERTEVVVVQKKVIQFQAIYEVIGHRGTKKELWVDPEMLQSLSPGTWLDDGAVDLFTFKAARLMRMNTGADVRVIETVLFRAWLDWASMKPGQVVPDTDKHADQETPGLLLKANLAAAELIIIPWVSGGHFSLAIVCNAGAIPRKSGLMLGLSHTRTQACAPKNRFFVTKRGL